MARIRKQILEQSILWPKIHDLTLIDGKFLWVRGTAREYEIPIGGTNRVTIHFDHSPRGKHRKASWKVAHWLQKESHPISGMAQID